MNHVENGINSADCNDASLATPDYITVPTANGRTTVRKDEMIRRLHIDLDTLQSVFSFAS